MPLTYQGLIPFNADDLGSTVQTIKRGPGLVFGLHIANSSPGDAFVQMFALPATAVVLGTTRPYVWFRILSKTQLTIAPIEPFSFNSDGISIASTTTALGNLPSLVSVTVFYCEA